MLQIQLMIRQAGLNQVTLPNTEKNSKDITFLHLHDLKLISYSTKGFVPTAGEKHLYDLLDDHKG